MAIARRTRRSDVIALGAFLLGPLVFFAVPALIGYPLLTGDDVIQNYPLRALAGAIFRAGHLPIFNPYAFSGTPLLGSINSGAAFPTIIFFVLLPHLAAWVAAEATTFSACMIGAFALLRLRSVSTLSAVIGAVSFGFIGYVSSQAVHIDVVDVAAAFIWAIVAMEVIANHPRARRGAWTAVLGFAIGCIGLAGSPETSAYASIGVLIYAGHLLIAPILDRARLCLCLAFGIFSGVALAAIQLVPGAEFVAVSQHASGSLSFLVAGSLHPANLALLLAPHVLGGGPLGLRPFVGTFNLAELDSYGGIFALSALGGLAMLARTPGAKSWRVWYVIGGVGLLLAFGGATPLPQLVIHFPVLSSSRLPARALILLAPSLAILSAYWCEVLLVPTRDHTLRRHAARAGSIGPALVLALVVVLGIAGEPIARALAGKGVGPWHVHTVAPYLVVTGLIALGAMFCSLRTSQLSARLRAGIIVGVFALDLVAFIVNQSSFAPIYRRAITAPNPVAARLAHLVGNGRTFIVDPNRVGGITLDELGAPDLNALDNINSAQGYGSLSWNPYAAVTGTHGQNVAAPAMLRSKIPDTLDVTTLLIPRAAFLVSLRDGRSISVIHATGDTTTRYFGENLKVESIDISAPGNDHAALRRIASSVRLMQSNGARLAPVKLNLRPTVAHIAFGSRTGLGVIVHAPDGARLTISVTTIAGRYSPSGALAGVVAPAHWQPQAPLRPYDVFTNIHHVAPLRVFSGGPVRIKVVSGSVFGADFTVALHATRQAMIVRSVADLPGWEGVLTHADRTAPIKIHQKDLVQEVSVPRGDSLLQFSYHPPGLAFGELGTALGAAALFTLVLWTYRPRALRRQFPRNGSGAEEPARSFSSD